MTDNNRRRFSRIHFDAPCQLHQGERNWSCRVLDISLKGLLLSTPDGFDGDCNEPFESIIYLADDESAIVMALELKHEADDQLGFKCQYIDLESATHLKRLVELNLGDDTLLQRELARLGTD